LRDNHHDHDDDRQLTTFSAVAAFAATQERKWQSAVRTYFKDGEAGVWLSRTGRQQLPSQGWKLHVTCTVANCDRVLDIVGSHIAEHDLSAKAIRTVRLLKILNAGLAFGYSQVGKAFTLYFPSTDQFLTSIGSLAPRLENIAGPAVPYDFAIGPSKCLFYRYGAFDRSGSLTAPDGRLVPDERNRAWLPDWVSHPLDMPTNEATRIPDGSVVYSCLSQRGKGGVYLALDLLTKPPRPIIIKEGRRHGEVGWDLRDGYDLVANEARTLDRLNSRPIGPRLLWTRASATVFYIGLEKLAGKTLWDEMVARSPLLRNAAKRRRLIERLIDMLGELHRRGIAWQDIKPQNIICTARGPRFLDFEGSREVAHAEYAEPWVSPGFQAPEMRRGRSGRSLLAQDAYAMGKILYLIEAAASRPAPVSRVRLDLPPVGNDGPFGRMVAAMTAHRPGSRPAMARVLQSIRAANRPRARAP